VSVQELKVLARKHWEEWLPERVKELKAEGRLNAELEAAASLAQEEIEHLMRRGYSECEAREVALPAVHPLEAGVPGAGRPGPQSDRAERGRPEARTAPTAQGKAR
jgi:hypothetical protein